MFRPLRGQGDNLGFPIGPKNTYLVTDIETLLPVNSRWIPLLKRLQRNIKVENVSANQGLGGYLGFPFDPKITKILESVKILFLV